MCKQIIGVPPIDIGSRTIKLVVDGTGAVLEARGLWGRPSGGGSKEKWHWMDYKFFTTQFTWHFPV
jgi:hypothetical protein